MTRSASWSSRMRAAPGAATMPISRRRTGGSASTIFWNPAGRPMPRSRASAAPIAPTRRSRRCSVRSRPTSRPRSASSRPSPGVSTRSAPSRAASARPAARVSSGPRTIWKAPMRAMRCVSSICCCSRARSTDVRSTAFEDATGLRLTDEGGLRDELPPITTFLNRLLALTIELQNILFTAFEQLLGDPHRGRDRLGDLRCRP